MTADHQHTQGKSSSARWGGGRAAILWRLERKGHFDLIEQVRNHQISAAHAARLAGFGDNRRRLRKNEVAIPAEDYKKTLWYQYTREQQRAASAVPTSASPKTPSVHEYASPEKPEFDPEVLIP